MNSAIRARSPLRFISLFSGIGGFDLGLERASMQCVAQVEKDPFCLKVLHKHWPNVPKFTDIHTFTREDINGAIDLIAGGFPCQPFSKTGQQCGAADDRNLWPQMFRVVQEYRPAWVIGENVPALANIYLDTVQTDLESAGYTTRAVVLPACAFGHPQRRERIFILGYTDRLGRQACDLQDFKPHQASAQTGSERRWPWLLDRSSSGRLRALPDAGVYRAFDGVPGRLERYRALGNAVVPQVAEWLGRHIVEVTHGQLV